MGGATLYYFFFLPLFYMQNGMTPLHLSVWYSIRSEDYATVKTLLEYNADCSAKDNVLQIGINQFYFEILKSFVFLSNCCWYDQEGKTPLDHLSNGPGSAKLRELLLWHSEEQRKRRALEACSETKAKMDELENELSNIVGLHELKIQLRKWAKGMLLDERRKALGLKVGARRPPHMAFLGNPGTGTPLLIIFYKMIMFSCMYQWQ